MPEQASRRVLVLPQLIACGLHSMGWGDTNLRKGKCYFKGPYFEGDL